MRTEQIQVFKFSELSAEAQKKVLDRLREINVNYDYWDYLEYELKEDLKKIGVEYEKVYFSTDRDRYIYIDNPKIVNQEAFKNGIFSDDNKKIVEELKEKEKEQQDFFIGTNRNNNFVGLNDEILDEKEAETEAYTDFLNNILNKFLKAVDEAYYYNISDEAVKDTIEANEMEFLKDGRSF